MSVKKVCIVGASGKLGQYMARHALDRGYEVVGVCRERSVGKLSGFKGLIEILPGATNDRRIFESDTLWTVVRGSNPDRRPDWSHLLNRESLS